MLTGTRMPRYIWPALGGIVLLGAALRLWAIGSVPFGVFADEAANMLDARRLLEAGDFRVMYPAAHDMREGMMIWLQALSQGLLGQGFAAVRLPAALMGSLTIPAVFYACYQLLLCLSPRDKESGAALTTPAAASRMALLATGLFAGLLWHVFASRIGFRAVLEPFWMALAIGAVAHGMRSGKLWPMALAGLAGGLGLYGYSSIRLTLLALPVLWLIAFVCRGMDARQALRQLAVLAGVGLLVSLPMLIAVLGNLDQAMARSAKISVFSQDEPLKEMGISFAAVMQMLFFWGDRIWRHNIAGAAQILLVLRPLLAVGLYLLITRSLMGEEQFTPAKGRRKSSLAGRICPREMGRGLAGFLLIWIILAAMPAILTYDTRPHAFRSIGMIIPLMLLIALSSAGLWRLLAGRITALAKLGPVVAGALIAVQMGWAGFAYFTVWAKQPDIAVEFMAESWRVGEMLATEEADAAQLAVLYMDVIEDDPEDVVWGAHPLVWQLGWPAQGQDAEASPKIAHVKTDADIATALQGATRAVLFDIPPEQAARIRAAHPALQITFARLFVLDAEADLPQAK